MQTVSIPAAPEAFSLPPASSALLIIDMQRDFLERGGFGDSLGNDVHLLQSAVEPCRQLLETARAMGMLVIHTREGHRADMTDAFKAKVERGSPNLRIGDMGPMGRILIRGEPGHDIIPALYPLAGEPVIDKPGKGSFYATDLEAILRNKQIDTLIVCGVTTEVCVHTTVREANDRGFRCLIPGDCCASYRPEFHRVSLEMFQAQSAIFGWVTDSKPLCAALLGQD
ncbi:MAG TPA: isochorismatase family cysteine hydrolase [Methylophilus sp.]